MATTPREPDIGKRIVANRLHRQLSQAAVSRRAGIHPSYLSRIETGRVHPTVRTASRIAAALKVTLDDLLGPTPPERRNQPCPVSPDGSCILDLIEAGSETATSQNGRYSPRQLRLLRRFAALLQRSQPGVLKVFEVLVAEFSDSGGGSGSRHTRPGA